jgi:cell division protein FtsL
MKIFSNFGYADSIGIGQFLILTFLILVIISSIDAIIANYKIRKADYKFSPISRFR